MFEGPEQFFPRLVQCFGGLDIADCQGCIVELLEGDTGEQVLFDIVERLELIVRCHRVGIAIALSHPALVVALLCREQARTVVVQKWRQPVPVKGVDLPREALRDVGVAEPLPHHRCVLALRQGVVVGAPGARFGELPDVQLVLSLSFCSSATLWLMYSDPLSA